MESDWGGGLGGGGLGGGGWGLFACTIFFPRSGLQELYFDIICIFLAFIL